MVKSTRNKNLSKNLSKVILNKVSFLPVILSSILLISCSKSDDNQTKMSDSKSLTKNSISENTTTSVDSGANKITESFANGIKKLLNKVPSESFLIFTQESDSTGFKSLKKTPLGESYNMQFQLNLIDESALGADTDLSKVVKGLKSGLKELSTICPDGCFSNLVGFIGVNFNSGDKLQTFSAEKNLNAGVYTDSKDNINLADALDKVQQKFSENNVKTEKNDSIKGAEKAYSLDIKGKVTQTLPYTGTDSKNNKSGKKPAEITKEDLPFETKLYLAATKDNFTISQNQTDAINLFDNANTSSQANFLSTPEFAKSIQTVSLDDSTRFGFSYVDLVKLVSKVKEFVPDEITKDVATDVSDKSAGSKQATDPKTLPKNEKFDTKELKTLISNQPFSSAIQGRYFDKNLIFKNSLVFKEDQKFDRSKFKNDKFEILSGIPKDSVLGLSLNFPLLLEIINHIGKSLQFNVDKYLVGEAKVIKELSEVNLAFKPSTSGSPFPDVIIVAISKTTNDSLKALISSSMMMLGAMGGNAKSSEKDIDGVKVNYVVTPFAVGVYFGEYKGNLIVSSSEPGFKSSLQALKEPATSLYSEASKEGSSLLSNKNNQYTILSSYVDFPAFGTILQNLQGSLGMFLGGKATAQLDQISNLKKLGKVISTGEIRDNNIYSEIIYK